MRSYREPDQRSDDRLVYFDYGRMLSTPPRRLRVKQIGAAALWGAVATGAFRWSPNQRWEATLALALLGALLSVVGLFYLERDRPRSEAFVEVRRRPQ